MLTAVVRVCAWCRLFLGLKGPLQRWTVTHGICPACRDRFGAGPFEPARAAGTLVVSEDPLGVEAAGELIGRAAHPTVVLADRRRGDRRRAAVQVSLERRRGDRRAPPPASWARGYFFVESATDPELADLILG
jgi:hypothetical protein